MYVIITDIMYIHNSKLFYILALILTTSFASNEAFAATTPLPLISNPKSSSIQNILFTPTNTTSIGIGKSSDKVENYLINVFCSEVIGKQVKAASGSGIFLSDPTETVGIILTNAHVARHLLDSNKKCVGRTGSPTTTTHTLALRYIPTPWINAHSSYVVGDNDQSSTGEYDFAILEATRIKPLKKDASNIYNIFKTNLKLKLDNYDEASLLNTTYIYSYPAQQILSRNVYNPLYQKKDSVRVSAVYSSPSENISNSLLDVTGSKFIDHGSSGGLVISQGTSNSIIGLSGILINSQVPQTVRVITLKHVLSVVKADLTKANNAQTDSFLILIGDLLNNKDIDVSLVQIFKNIKLTSVLEQYTRDTLRNLRIIR